MCDAYLASCRAKCNTQTIYDYRCEDVAQADGTVLQQRQCLCVDDSRESLIMQGASCAALDASCLARCRARRAARRDGQAPCYATHESALYSMPCTCDACDTENFGLRVGLACMIFIAGLSATTLSILCARARKSIRVDL